MSTTKVGSLVKFADDHRARFGRTLSRPAHDKKWPPALHQDAPNQEPDDTGPPARRRKALDEFETLGPLYRCSTTSLPARRFWSTGTFFFRHSEAYYNLLGVVMAAIAMGVARPSRSS